MGTETFKHYCTCGGHAWQMNGRPKSQPHMSWCPQRAEYAEWFAQLKSEADALAMTPEEWERERSIAEQLNRAAEPLPKKK